MFVYPHEAADRKDCRKNCEVQRFPAGLLVRIIAHRIQFVSCFGKLDVYFANAVHRGDMHKLEKEH